MPKVSIIIPTYNSGGTVKNALESVYKQSFQDWECIVVDGASKDNTLSIIKEYVGKDARFRFISEKDHGIYDAFNKGWHLSKGEWIYYLGSDDTLTVAGMENIARELDDQYAMVTGDVFLERADGTWRLQEYQGYFGCHQGVLMKREVLQRLNGFDEQYRILADYELMIRVKQADFKVKNVREPLACFFVGGESQRLQSQWEKMRERYTINKRYEMKRFPLMSSLFFFCAQCAAGIYRQILTKHK